MKRLSLALAIVQLVCSGAPIVAPPPARGASGPPGEVVYLRHRRLWQVCLASAASGRIESRLDRGLEMTGSAVFSPDGRRLAYVERGAGFSVVSVVDVDDGKLSLSKADPFPKDLAEAAQQESPTWLSSDRLVFAGGSIDYTTKESGGLHLYYRDLGTGEVGKLSSRPGMEPSASPTTGLVVFTSYEDTGKTFEGLPVVVEKLQVLDTNSGRIRTLASERFPQGNGMWAFSEPRISPDGRYVAYHFKAPHVMGNVFVIIDSTNGKTVWTSQPTCQLGGCAWSADSTRLAFADAEGADLSSPARVTTYDVAAGGQRVICSPGASQVGDLSWSPDGQWLAFTFAPQDSDRMAAGVVGLAGHVRLLSAGAFSVAWRPVASPSPTPSGSSSSTAVQASCYGVKYSGSSGLGANDETLIADFSAGELRQAGYHAAALTDSSAQDAFDRLAADRVFVFGGHGSPHGVYFQLPDGGDVSVLQSRFWIGDIALQCVSVENADLADLALAVFMACDCGKGANEDGNILKAFNDDGTSVAIGFAQDVGPSVGSWMQSFFAYATEDGLEVGAAANKAGEDCCAAAVWCWTGDSQIQPENVVVRRATPDRRVYIATSPPEVTTGGIPTY